LRPGGFVRAHGSVLLPQVNATLTEDTSTR
jgi:hypothetical protein